MAVAHGILFGTTATGGQRKVLVDATGKLVLAGAGAGEDNTASNVGTGGVGVFKQKTGVDLEFKNINAGSPAITIIDDAGDNEVDIDVAVASEIQAGVAELATQAETDTGTDDTKMVTPLKLANTTLMGDVSGPISAVDNNVAAFDGVTGKLIKDSGVLTANILDKSVDDSDDITEGATQRFVTIGDETNLGNLSGINSGDEVTASEGFSGVAELATQAEVNTGTDDLRIITPLKLASANTVITTQIGAARNNANSSQAWLRAYDGGVMNTQQYVVPFDCEIIAISAGSNAADTWDAEVYKNADIVASPTEGNAIVDLAITVATDNVNASLSVALLASDRIAIFQRSAVTVNRPRVDIILRRT